MKSYWRSVSGLFALVFLLGCGGVQTLPTPEIDGLGVALDSTVGLVNEHGRSRCAGVWLDRQVVTAAHCAPEVSKEIETWVGLYVDWDGKSFRRSFPFRTIYWNEEQDLAVLAPASVIPAGSHHSVQLAEHPPVWGQQVVVVGHPLGLPYTVTSGIVSYPRRETGPFASMVWTQISAPVSPGNSGGPVFDHYGGLLGIVSFRLFGPGGSSEPHLAGAVHWEVIKSVLQTARGQ